MFVQTIDPGYSSIILAGVCGTRHLSRLGQIMLNVLPISDTDANILTYFQARL